MGWIACVLPPIALPIPPFAAVPANDTTKDHSIAAVVR
jgi:hypothetical protein